MREKRDATARRAHGREPAEQIDDEELQNHEPSRQAEDGPEEQPQGQNRVEYGNGRGRMKGAVSGKNARDGARRAHHRHH